MPQVRVRQDGVLVVDQGYNPGVVPYRASGTPDGTSPMYGAGGLFGVCGNNPTLVNACVNPIGIEGWFTWVASDEESPIYDALTWVGSSGSAQTGLCTDCGKPSYRECAQSACFGRLCQMTNEHALDMLGMRMNRGVPDVALFGDITDATGRVLIARGQPIRDAFVLDIAAAAYNLRYLLAQQIWTGNPANNVGGHWEFPGMQLIVNTGKADALTGIACNGLDSYMFNYNAIVGAVGAPNIVDYFTAAKRTSDFRLAGANHDPRAAERAFWMHPRHWDCVSDAYACSYGLTCTNMGAATRNDAMALREFANEIKGRSALPIDGEWIPVGLDTQIPLTAVPIGNDTGWRGDIYFLTKVVDGRTVFWGEYQDLSQTAGATLSWFRRMFGSSPIAVTDGGRYFVAPTVEGGLCVDARLFTKPRLICITPQYQMRLQNFTCVPLGTYNDVTGSGGLYEVGGGPSSKPYMYLYGDCA